MRRAILVAGAVCLAIPGCGDGGNDVFVSEPGVELVGFYDPCSFDDQCPIETTCNEIAIDYGDEVVVDATCTVACGSDFDCPLDGLCLGASTGPPLCYEPCFDDLDCPIGFGCVQDAFSEFFEPVCMPI